MRVTEFYRAFMEGMGVVVTEAGHVLRPTKEETPIQVEGKDVVLPTKYYLDQNDWSKVHPYHPLCEDALMGQSPTFHLTNVLMRITLTQHYSALIRDILKVASDPDLQKVAVEHNPEIHTILAGYPDAKKGVVTSWKNVYKTFETGKNYIASIYVSRNKEIDGKIYQRSGRVSIPLLEDTDTKSMLGVDIPNLHIAGIRAIVTRIFDPVPREFHSNSPTPYFDTLLQYYRAMVERYNDIVALFGPVIEVKPLPTEWVDFLPDMEKMRKRIPRLPGNEGVKVEKEVKRNEGIDMDDDAFGDIKLPASKPPRVRDEEDDNPPWSDEPTERRGSSKRTGVSIHDIPERRGRDRDYDDDDRHSYRDRDRSYRGRDRGRDRDRSRRDDRRDSRRGRDNRRDDRRSGRRGGGFSIHDM